MVFFSYAREDVATVRRFRDELEKYGPIFFDTESVEGGAEWERTIDRALRDCSLFIPFVSPASNESSWVTKECLLALKLEKPILPALIQGDLPLRLIDLQYVDCRGEFEAAISDILEAMSHHGVIRKAEADVDSLLANAIRERLTDNVRASNALAERAILMEPELASNVATFWRKLLASLDTDMAGELSARLRIVERACKLDKDVGTPDKETWEWSLELDGDEDVLGAIDSVTYNLHPTFPNPTVRIRSAKDSFRIKRIGWGVFTARIQVEFVDNTCSEAFYMLTFAERASRAFLDTSD